MGGLTLPRGGVREPSGGGGGGGGVRGVEIKGGSVLVVEVECGRTAHHTLHLHPVPATPALSVVVVGGGVGGVGGII
ncbi:hypothetical protein Pmani_025332 [Petrolisthes manimaculis]|uniref:Uncharacterized protein n=1 Tax=Petrolisthes manimaculis TaxID=1843537 RepID=A0AAE1P847_9EUCA|nr:hypothetical protein Pmani_025332 [Petrolisthes manimaculis]